MEEEIKKHREERERSEKIFKELDRTREHFIEATKKVTEAEKHLEETEKMRAQTEKTIQETEGRIKRTEESVAKVHEGILESGPSKPAKTEGQTGKTSPAKRRQG